MGDTVGDVGWWHHCGVTVAWGHCKWYEVALPWWGERDEGTWGHCVCV